MASKKTMLHVIPADLQKTLRKFDRVYGAANTEIPKVLETGAWYIERDAKNTIVGYGPLRATVHTFKVHKMNFGVGTNMEYAPYVEFGTGNMVSVPPGYESFAIQFKGKGIRQVNLPARPYLLPAFEYHKPRIIASIRKLLKEAVR